MNTPSASPAVQPAPMPPAPWRGASRALAVRFGRALALAGRRQAVAPSIRSRLSALAALFLGSVAAWDVALLQSTPDDTTRVLALAAHLIAIAGLVATERLARAWTVGTRQMAESVARLAAELPTLPPAPPVREAAALATALGRIETLLRERTAERDRAHAAERRWQHGYSRMAIRASHDALTGLVNRAGFDRRLEELMAVCRRDARRLTAFAIDVDGFKQVNDDHGHAVGDELLRVFAARLRAGVRQSDVVARVGGDEFVVLIDQATPAAALATADGLVDSLSRPYPLSDRCVEVSASIGIATSPAAGCSAGELMAAADAALYRAKRSGKRRHVTSGFTPL